MACMEDVNGCDATVSFEEMLNTWASMWMRWLKKYEKKTKTKKCTCLLVEFLYTLMYIYIHVSSG